VEGEGGAEDPVIGFILAGEAYIHGIMGKEILDQGLRGRSLRYGEMQLSLHHR
jgi:hypothetical protein